MPCDWFVFIYLGKTTLVVMFFVSPKQKLLAKILNILEGVIKNSTVILDNIFLVKIKAISRSLPVKEGKELKDFLKLQTVANELPLLCMFYLWASRYSHI